MVFNQSTERRMAILEDLSLQGMDVTYPKNLSSRIDTQHAELESAELESALLQNRDGVLISITNGLKLHNRQFRATVEGYKMSLQAQIKRQNEQNEQFKVRKSSIEFTMPYHKFSNGLFFPSSVML